MKPTRLSSVDWIVADTIRCSLSLRTTPQSNFPCSSRSSISIFTREKKILCSPPPPLWIRFLSFDFGHTKKPPHHITKDKRIFLSDFAMLCNGFEIQNLCCILPAEKSSVISAAVSIFHLIMKCILCCRNNLI